MHPYTTNSNKMSNFRFALKVSLLSALLLVQAGVKAQVVNNGGTIRIETGGALICSGSVTNASGTISNDGRIEVQGNFNNAGTYHSSSNRDSLLMLGSGNALLNPGSASFSFLTINKASNSDVVTLGGSAIVKTKLDYLSGTLSTDYANNPSYVLSAPATAVFNMAPGQQIIGTVKRTAWTNGSSILFNAPQLQVTTNGGTAPADISVTMLPQAHGGDPAQEEKEVKRRFLLAQNGGNGFTADVRFPYDASELNTNVEANLTPWYLNASEWNALLTSVSRDAVNRSVTVTEIPAASFAQEWKLADPRYTFNVLAFLKGGWNNPTSLMRTALSTGGKLPLTQPYNTAPFNYSGTESVTSIPNANVVDWVLLELRKPASGLAEDAGSSTVIGRKAGFLLTNGNIVDLDGTSPLSFDISKQGAGNFVVLRHRNHLAVMSNAMASNLTASFANDFSLLGNVYAKLGATSQPVALLAASGAGSTRYGLWPGDVNRNGSITSSDVTPVNTAIAGPASGNTNIYDIRDVNLDRNITSADVSVTNASVASFASSSTAGIASEKKIESHVPGEVKK
jgi:hypothetical protein